MGARRWLAAVALVVAARAARVPGGEVRLWAGGAAPALVYTVETTALANEAARHDQEVGWQIAARLAVRPVACAEHEVLLHFELRKPELLLRGAARHAEWFARPSAWDAPAQRAASFYAHWRAGEVLRAFLDPNDPPAIAGYKRALISLFQFQILDGERNETDVSGECDVFYETIDEYVFRKIKRGCRWLSTDDATSGVSSRRLTRYTLRPALDAISSLHSEELHELRAVEGSEGGEDAGVKVRAWTRLQLDAEEPAPRCAPAPPGLQPHIDALPLTLHETTLPLTVAEDSDESAVEDEEPEDAPLSLGAALSLAESLSWREAGAGGDEPAARALLRALPALRAAPAPALARHLATLHDIDRLTGVARALGAAGTGAAHEAAAQALQLRAEPLQPAADAYLCALGAAPAPHAAAVRGALSLAGDCPCPRVRAAALLAAAAAAPRADPALAAALRDDLAKQLARCKDDECRELRVTALGNLRRADSGELLLEQAARGSARVALAALWALGAAPPAALPGPRLARLVRLALERARPLDVRAAALDLAVRRSAHAAMGLAQCARALHEARRDHELRRVFWQRLHALAPHHEPVRLFLRAVRNDPELRSWHAQAQAGTSSVLWREAGWGWGGWRAALDSAQVAAGGVLRAGRVELQLAAPDNTTRPALALHLWTAGLDALVGGDAPGDVTPAADEHAAGDVTPAAEEDAAAGLALELAGARLPPVTLFSSQAELLGLVWSGAGSSPTPVLRAALSLGERGASLPLLAGVAASLRAHAAAALALDAHAAVSLWSRTASARLDLRAAVAARAAARVRAPWGPVAVRVEAHAPARLRIAADLDFYSRVALCVRARVDEHRYARAAALRSVLGARRWRVSRRRAAAAPRAGRTLALGAHNDRACRALTPHDD